MGRWCCCWCRRRTDGDRIFSFLLVSSLFRLSLSSLFCCCWTLDERRVRVYPSLAPAAVHTHTRSLSVGQTAHSLSVTFLHPTTRAIHLTTASLAPPLLSFPKQVQHTLVRISNSSDQQHERARRRRLTLLGNSTATTWVEGNEFRFHFPLRQPPPPPPPSAAIFSHSSPAAAAAHVAPLS